MSRLGASTRRNQLGSFKLFMKWVRENDSKFKDYTPDQLVEYQRQADNGTRYEVLDIGQNYVLQTHGTVNTKKQKYHILRSFFLHNRAELPRDKLNVRAGNGVRPSIQGTLTVEEIKTAILSSNPVYQAIYISMFQSAMDQEMFIYWNMNGYESLLEQIRQKPSVIKIDLPGRKRSRNEKPYYTFIGKDSINSINTWLEYRAKFINEGKLSPDSTFIFCNQHGDPITKPGLKQYWIRRLRKLGMIQVAKGEGPGSKTGKGLHEMRDVWRSLWSKSPASHIVSEYLMGHSIDPLNYDKSFRDVEFYREEYMKAVPFLNLMSSGAAFGLVESKEINKLRRDQDNRVTELEAKLERMETLLMDALNNPEALAETKRRLSS